MQIKKQDVQVKKQRKFENKKEDIIARDRFLILLSALCLY
jgi:hypothetical protein